MATTNNPALEDKINFSFDIRIIKSILHSIHSTDLIHRQPTEEQRAASADAISLLEQRLTKTEHELEKRESCGKRLQRLFTCRDKDYTDFVELSCELREMYSALLLNATPTPPLQAQTPESSIRSSNSRSSSDPGLWMKGSDKANEWGKKIEEERGDDEQIEDPTPELRVTPATPASSKISTNTSSSSTTKASKVDLPKKVREEETTIDEQIAEWMKGRNSGQDSVEGQGEGEDTAN
ncbi:hypothetical protein N431DRAFT_469083 [Stipitochalara longipes BDJ]|nr:hypothetical protein N431DRAFT_469083 [Stipitochalara longipes BDJ]